MRLGNPGQGCHDGAHGGRGEEDDGQGAQGGARDPRVRRKHRPPSNSAPRTLRTPTYPEGYSCAAVHCLLLVRCGAHLRMFTAPRRHFGVSSVRVGRLVEWRQPSNSVRCAQWALNLCGEAWTVARPDGGEPVCHERTTSLRPRSRPPRAHHLLLHDPHCATFPACDVNTLRARRIASGCGPVKGTKMAICALCTWPCGDCCISLFFSVLCVGD